MMIFAVEQKGEPMSDLIDRQVAINEILEVYEREYPTASGAFDEFVVRIIPNILRNLPSAQSEQRWIPFVLRPATDEEKEENSGFDYYLDGKIPDDGQKILITVKLPGHEEVQADEFYSDADGSYLDGQYEIGTEAVAWMPKPEPYKGK